MALVRTGIVLDRRGGALPKMLPPFQMFVGGPLGSGTQYMPWIHKDDWVRLVTWTITAEGARGAAERDEPVAGHQRGVLEGARPRAETAEPAAGAGVCAAASRSAKWPTRCC